MPYTPTVWVDNPSGSDPQLNAQKLNKIEQGIQTAQATAEAGSGGSDVFYTHTQGVAAATWSITHNLGKFPAVTVVDSAGNQLLTSVSYTDANSLVVSFAGATSGKAYLN